MSRCRHARDFAARSLTRTRRFLKSRLFQAGQFDVNLASELKIAICRVSLPLVSTALTGCCYSETIDHPDKRNF